MLQPTPPHACSAPRAQTEDQVRPSELDAPPLLPDQRRGPDRELLDESGLTEEEEAEAGEGVASSDLGEQEGIKLPLSRGGQQSLNLKGGNARGVARGCRTRWLLQVVTG